MSSIKKLTICLVVNTIILLVVIVLVSCFADKQAAYWRWGPGSDLIVISVNINTWNRYLLLNLIIFVIRISQVLVEELGMPVLGFSIYNPDKKVVEDFTKNQLQFFANSMFIVSGLRGVFLQMVTIAQIDIAIISLLVSEGASFITIRILLNEKKFTRDQIVDIEMAGLALSDTDT